MSQPEVSAPGAQGQLSRSARSQKLPTKVVCRRSVWSWTPPVRRPPWVDRVVPGLAPEEPWAPWALWALA